MTDRPPAPQGTVIPEDQAKQGRRGFHVLAVLIVSVVLVVIAFVALATLRPHPATDTGAPAAANRVEGATKGTGS